MQRFATAALLLAFGGFATADEKSKMDARSVVEKYVFAALAAQVDDAKALAVAGQSPSRKERIEEFRTLVFAKAIKMPTVWSDDRTGKAIAVSEEIKLTKAKPDGRLKGFLVISLIRSGDKWLVKDIDLDAEEKAKAKVDKFQKQNPDAKELAAGR